MKKSLAFFLVLCATFISSAAKAQLPVTPQGKFIELNRAKIYYEEYGQGEPLILLHGFGRTLEDWRPFIPAFAKQYLVIAWDMRGHGRSTSPDSSDTFLHAAAAKDLLDLIERLDLKNVKAIGHSSGGILLLDAATRNPTAFEAIVPASAQLYFGGQIREFIRNNARPEDYFAFNEMKKQHGKTKGELLSRQFYHFSELAGDPDITPDELRAVTARSLIVHGDNDFLPVSQAWEMYQYLEGAHLWIVPNGWHMPHLGPSNEADFIRITLAFLKGDWDTESPRN